MQAIIVRYHGPTDYKPSRYTASCPQGRVTISYDYGDNDQERTVAEILCHKLQKLANDPGSWPIDKMVGGTLPNGDTVFVFNV
jgi:uncharacterized protein (UPF0297 family)